MKFSVCLSLGLLFAACGSNEPAVVDVKPIVIDAATEPSLAVVATPSTVTRGGAVTLAVTPTNFTVIDPRTNPPVKSGEGHYHYYLDDAANYTAAWTPSVTITTGPNTTVGVHTVRVVLVTSAHVEVTPAVGATVTYTVE